MTNRIEFSLKHITTITLLTAIVLILTAGKQLTFEIKDKPAIPKVDRVIPLPYDPISTAPGVFFYQNFEVIENVDSNFHDTGGINDSLMRISNTDAFSGTKAVQNTYIAKEKFPESKDPGGSGWFWRFFGDNKIDSNFPVRDTIPRTRIFARWYHKFEEGFTPQKESGTFPPKMARMRCFGAPPWKAVYSILFWIEDKDAHISIEQHTRAPGISREWLSNYYTIFSFKDPGNIGRWIHFELGVSLGEGHYSDRVQAWADGKLICDIDKQDLAGGYREQTLNGMLWDCYWNGGAPRTESRFYDDLVLSGQPIGPVRTSITPTVQKAPFMEKTEQNQKEWQIEVAATEQVPMCINDTDRATPKMHFQTVWHGTVMGETNKVVINAHQGKFIGPLTGKKQLEYNTLYSIRLRQQANNSIWSDWSLWHSAFATTWAPDVKPDKRAPAKGYLVGHRK